MCPLLPALGPRVMQTHADPAHAPSVSVSSFVHQSRLFREPFCPCFSITYAKIGRIQRRLAWLLREDNMQMCKVFRIFKKSSFFFLLALIEVICNSIGMHCSTMSLIH